MQDSAATGEGGTEVSAITRTGAQLAPSPPLVPIRTAWTGNDIGKSEVLVNIYL